MGRRSLNATIPYNHKTAPDGYRSLCEISNTIDIRFREIEHVLNQYFDPKRFSLIGYVRSKDIVVCIKEANEPLRTVFEISKSLKTAQLYGYCISRREPQFRGIAFYEKLSHVVRSATQLGLSNTPGPFGHAAGIIRIMKADSLTESHWKTLMNISYA